MNIHKTGQVSSNAAEIYDEFFVPALFAEWPHRLLDITSVAPGERVLDVACGTGVLANTVAGLVEPGGTVTGLDINPGMLDVARRKNPTLVWKSGRAEELPFDSESYDAVYCNFGLMFFDDKPRAVQEMVRVLRPGGRLGVVVWDALEHSPGFLILAKLIDQMCGAGIAEGLRAPYNLGDRMVLQSVFAEAGYPKISITTLVGKVRFPSLNDFVFINIKGWTLADQIDEQQYNTLLQAAEKPLRRFVKPDGRLVFDSPAHIATLHKH